MDNTQILRAPTVAERGAAIVTERMKTYGDPTAHFKKVADLWNALLGVGEGGRLVSPLTAADVCQLQRLLKEARLSETPGHVDSLIDIPGYADCQARVLGVQV